MLSKSLFQIVEKNRHIVLTKVNNKIPPLWDSNLISRATKISCHVHIHISTTLHIESQIHGKIKN